MASPHKRRNMDVLKLMMSDYHVEMTEDDGSDFYVDFTGPKDTAYEGGQWQVHVCLPVEYPFRSPSIGFKNRIYHPNVDFRSGTICLDVINQTWSPMFDLINIFDVFLPQLLLYPNPSDPLNSEAAALLLDNPNKFASKVREYVLQYAGGTDFIPNQTKKESDITSINVSVSSNSGIISECCQTVAKDVVQNNSDLEGPSKDNIVGIIGSNSKSLSESYSMLSSLRNLKQGLGSVEYSVAAHSGDICKMEVENGDDVSSLGDMSDCGANFDLEI